MKMLVTGASGLIGSHTARQLREQGHEVYATDIVGDVDRVDLLDKEAIRKYIELVRPEVIFHYAANAAEGKAQFSPIDITKRNIEIFLNVLVPAINCGFKRLVFTSSIAVYGSIQIPFRESDPPIPQDIYGINKLAIEQMIRVLSNVHGFEYVIARPHNVYGPGQNMKDPYRNVVTIFMNHLLNGNQYSIYGDGSMKRSFSYVGDVVDVLCKCGIQDVSGMVVNIGTEKSYSIMELSDVIQKVSGTTIIPEFLPDRPQEVHTAKSSHAICKHLFGYKDTPLEDGIRATWEWAKSEGYQVPEFSEIEIESAKLPKNWRKQ
jgi:UDP-glucose 4-epimerase